MSVYFQFLCMCAVNFIEINMVTILAWPSYTYKIYGSANTTLHRPMSPTEMALVGSLPSIGAVVGTPIAGFFLDIVGRRACSMCASLNFVLAWAMMAASTRVEVTLAAVFIAGLGCSGELIARVYVSEICQETVRGAMSTGSLVLYYTGFLISFSMGDRLDYNSMVYASLGLAVLGTMLLGAVKESPTYLMKKGLDDEATKSMAFYRRAGPNSRTVLREISTLRRAFDVDFKDDVNTTAEEEKLQPLEKDVVVKLSFWQFMKKSRSSRRGALLAFILMTASIFQGIFVIQIYAVPMFEEAVPSMSATLCSMVLAVINLASAVASGSLTDLAGRRPIMICSSISAGMCSLLLGFQLQYHWAPHWVTAVTLYTLTIAYSFGAGTVAYVFVADVFLPEIKSLMSMIILEWAWLCNFFVLFIFTLLVTNIGLGCVFYIFSAVCFFTALFSFFCQPETKGLPLDAVQLVLDKRKT